MLEDDLNKTEEADLAKAACAGDEIAFGKLFQLLYGRTHRTVWGMMSDEAAAHDVVQDAWIKAWNNREKYNFQSRFSTWVHRIAVNTALDALRRRKSRVSLLRRLFTLNEIGDSKREAGVHPDKNLLNKELGSRIEQAIATLPEEQRTVLVLREYDGYSYQEIASLIGCQTGTVMSRLHHARKKLQASLTKEIS